MTKNEAEQISVSIKKLGASTVIAGVAAIFTIGGYATNLQSQVTSIKAECAQMLASHVVKETETFRLYDERIDTVRTYNKELLEEVKKMRQELKEVYQLLTKSKNI